MNNLNEKSLEEILRRMIDEAPKTGAIPNTMFGSYTNDPRMPIFKPRYEIEVDFK